MKNFKILALLLLSGATLVACGQKEESNKSPEVEVKTSETVKSEEVNSSSEEKKESKEESKSEDSSDNFVETASDAKFEKGMLKGNTYSVKIKDYKVLEAKQDGNDNDYPIIVFYYDTLVNPNYTDDVNISPYSAWSNNFVVVQDNDPNKVNKLETASYTDNSVEDDLVTIKPGGTITSKATYKLTDTKTPVTLNAESISGSKFGSEEFKIK